MPTPFDDDAIRELLDLSFEIVCRHPVSDFVDVEQLLPTLDQALTIDRISQYQTRWLRPLRDRLLERAKKSSLLLGSWLPADVTQSLTELAGTPPRLPKRAIDDLVASEQVRENVRTMLSETLNGFLKGSGEGGGGGIGGVVGRGARVMGAASRGLFGGIGDGIQRALQDRVRDFVDGSVAAMQKRIAEKLTSDETAKALGARQRNGFLGLLRKTEAESAIAIGRLPFARIDPMVPKIIVHNLGRKELRDAIVAEVKVALDEMSKHTVGELLEQSGLKELTHQAVRSRVAPIARDIVDSPEFGRWFARMKSA